MEMLGMYPTFYMPQIGSAWVMGMIGAISSGYGRPSEFTSPWK